MLGYDKKLFILPFDHRASFIKGLLGEKTELTFDEKEYIKEQKQIIYEGFKKALENGVEKEEAAILVDEDFGKQILEDARTNGIQIVVSVEKSGTKEFDFNYSDFSNHLKAYEGSIAKVLLHIDSFKEEEKAKEQVEKLKRLNDWCKENNYKLLIEPLSSSKENQLEDELFIIQTLNKNGIEPDIWKVQGFYKREDYEKLSEEVTKEGKESVGLVILGGGEEKEKVEEMIRAGIGVNRIIGFAIGRTVFWEPIISLKNAEITREEAILKIAKNYLHFYNIFK
jgi:myo-inositol catabolism protein IolC